MARPWDFGVTWHLEQVTAPKGDSLSLVFVRDDHLKVTNGTAEDTYINRLIKTSRRDCERFTRRALYRQVWDLVMDRFPEGVIEVPRPPLLSVSAITYIDDGGVEQTWASSKYQISKPTGPNAQPARIAPAYSESYPTTRSQMGAVTVTFVCGYVDDLVSPNVGEVPEDLDHGRLLLIGELYKQRSESVHTLGQHEAVVRAHSFWWGYRVH